jgi:hypothetical protein
MIPRWGKHNGIKYSPRRSLLKICPACNNLFVSYNKGYRLYCSDICRVNKHKEQKRIINAKIRAKRDKFEHAERERIAYAEGLRSRKQHWKGTKLIPKPPLKENGEPDWEAYHETLTKQLKNCGVY